MGLECSLCLDLYNAFLLLLDYANMYDVNQLLQKRIAGICVSKMSYICGCIYASTDVLLSYESLL